MKRIYIVFGAVAALLLALASTGTASAHAAGPKPAAAPSAALAMSFDNCLQGEVARVCANWSENGTSSWNVEDIHMWNPGAYANVNFKAKMHNGNVQPVLGASSGATRCWLDNSTTTDDTCNPNGSTQMGGYWSNTLQVCVQAVGQSSKSTYTLTPYAKAISNGCAF